MTDHHLKSSWCLRTYPFDLMPPRKERIEAIFAGRKDQIRLFLDLTAGEPKGIFVTGIYGIGKSIYVLESIRQSQVQGSFCSYCKYRRSYGLERSILRELARELVKSDEGLVCATLSSDSGSEVQKNGVVKAVRHAEDPLWCISELVAHSNDSDHVPTLVIDDLDVGGAELSNAEEIVFAARSLRDEGFNVVLLGHPMGPTATYGSAANVLTPIHLEPLSKEELKQMMSNYLRCETLPETSRPHETFPFSDPLADLISGTIAEFNLTPRIFNFVCNLLLKQAAKDRLEEIDIDYFSLHWQTIATTFIKNTLQEIDREYLKIIYETGGYFSEDNIDAIEAIGGATVEIREARETLQSLVEANILIESSDTLLSRLEINKIFTDQFPYIT